MFYRIRIVTAIAVLLACSPATSGAVSVGDAVLEWNGIAVTRTLNATPAQAPVEQTRTMAIVQVSVHDAISGITGQYETYSSPGPAPANASPVAAAIAAAHHALRALFPDHVGTLDGNYQASLATHGVSSMDPGLEFGRSVAAGILALRSNDHSSEAKFDYTVPGAGTPGVWVRLGGAAALLPGWGAVTPFVLRSGSQFRPDGPPALDSEQVRNGLQRDPGDRLFRQPRPLDRTDRDCEFLAGLADSDLERGPDPGAGGPEPRPGLHRPGVRAHVSRGSRLRASPAGRQNTTTTSGAPSRRSSTAIWMTIRRRWATISGGRCLLRRRTPSTRRPTPPTAVRW